jgi:hypothetical protein
MTDLRDRLAAALDEKLLNSEVLGPIYVKEMANVLANAALSLPRIAIVELPEGADVGQRWLQFKNVVAGPDGNILDESASPAIRHNAATARSHAASLLAAANAAERG